MTFDRPEAWWLLALAAPIVAFHLHHRRRRAVTVSSVALWRDLAAGGASRGRFRRVRDAVALAMLVASLVALTAAAAGPVTGTAASEARRLAIVIDVSASTIYGERYVRVTPFSPSMEAQTLAMAIDHLAPQDEVTVWRARATPELLIEPTTDHAGIARRLNLARTLEPSGLVETTRLAVRAARGVSGRKATVLVFTNALGAEALRGFDAGDVDLIVERQAMNTWENAGIVACDLDPTDSTRLVVRVRTTDGAVRPRSVVLTDGRNGGHESAEAPLTFDASGAATASLSLASIATRGGFFDVLLEPPDTFDPDDHAYLMLLATKPLAVAVVADKPSPFLVEALRAMPDVVDPARTTLVAPGGDVGDADVVIADGVASVTTKPMLAFIASGKSVEKPLLWGVGTHPILAGVDLSPLRIARAVVLDPAAGETPIVASAAGPVGVAGPGRVTFGFRPDASTLPLEAAFPLLVRNALRWLARPSNAPRYVVAGEPWPDGDGALVPYPTPGGPNVVKSPTGQDTVVRWIPPKGFHLSPKTPTSVPSAASVVASLADRSRDADTRRRHAPTLAAVGAALLALGALLLPRTRPAPTKPPARPTSAPPAELAPASR